MKFIKKTYITNFLSFIFFLLFIYLYIKDYNSNIEVKGYYAKQSYFFIFLGFLFLIPNLIGKKLKIYFNIIVISFFTSLYAFEFFIYSKGNINFITNEYYSWENQMQSLQNEVIKHKAFPTLTVSNDELMSLSGKSKTLTIQCNEDDYFAKYTSDRYGFRNPDEIWDRQVDIVVLGDSHVHGDCVNEGKDVVSHIRKISGLTSINLGWRGTGPLRQLANYREYMLKKPKYLFWFYYETDIFNLEDEVNNSILMNYYLDDNFSQNLVNRRQEIDSILNDQKNKFVNQNFNKAEINKLKNLISFLKLYKTRYFVMSKFSSFETKDDLNETYKNKNQFLDYYFETVKKIKIITDKTDTKLVIVFIPAFKYDYSNRGKYLKYIKLKIFEEMKIKGIDIIDVENSIQKKYFFPNTLYPKLSRELHFNSKGYEFVANEVINYLDNKKN